MHHNPKFIYLYTTPVHKKLCLEIRKVLRSFMLHFDTGFPKKVPFEINL